MTRTLPPIAVPRGEPDNLPGGAVARRSRRVSRTDRARTVWRRVLLKTLALPVRAERLAGPRGACRRSRCRAVNGAPRHCAEWARSKTSPSPPRTGGYAETETRGAHHRALRILVIRPDHLGDLLMTTPALSLLRAGLPEAVITALVGPWALPALARAA